MKALQLAHKLIELALEHGNLEVKGSVDSTLYMEYCTRSYKNGPQWDRWELTAVKAGYSNNPYTRMQEGFGKLGKSLQTMGETITNHLQQFVPGLLLRPGTRVRYSNPGHLDVLDGCIGTVQASGDLNSLGLEYWVSFGGDLRWICPASRLEVLPWLNAA